MARLLRGRYEPLGPVAEGGQGRVLRARDHLHDRLVALKVRRLDGGATREDLLAEARILLELTPHPGLPLVRDDFFAGGSYYLVMDWVEGTSLAELLADEGAPGLPLASTLGWLEQVAAALDHLHGHRPPVVHADVKPGNVIVTAEGRAVLVDFGIARRRDAPGRGVLGTPGFLAPELAAGHPPTPAADVFGLAATAFTLLTGAPPGAGPRAGWPGIPAEHAERIERGLRRGLAVDPAQRPPSASALVAALRPPAATNLPHQLTSFVGRARELSEVERLLATTRLLTLSGIGGCGKTRLALELAGRLLGSYPGGVWLVELAALSDPDLLVQTVARVVGGHEEPGHSMLGVLTERIGSGRVLLLLDNCEHLLDACAGLAEALLLACPNLRILATSREPLGISGETTWRVPSLSLPEAGPLPPLARLERFEAVQLFRDRARAALPSFTLSEGTAPAVVHVCRRLDGIPLAIELAATRVASLGVEQVDRRLDDCFRVLTGGRRTALPRQQTLRATLDWSWDLLSDGERALLRRLSVFAGGCTLEAAEAVCTGDGAERLDVLELVSRLVDKSLVRHEEGRYRLLETVRQYARERLAASGEAAAIRGLHLAWFLAFAARAEPELAGPDQTGWLDALETEHDNLRAALAWSATADGATSLALATSLWWFWRMRGYVTEGRGWLADALARSEGAPTPLRAKALSALGLLTRDQGNAAEASALLEESLALSRSAGDLPGIAMTLNHVGILRAQDDPAAAVGPYEESLALHRRLGDTAQVARVLNNLGYALYQAGDLERAAAAVQESLALTRAQGTTRLRAITLHTLGSVREAQGRHAEAAAGFGQALELERQLNDKYDLPYCLEGLARVACAQGALERGVRLLGAAHALHTSTAVPMEPAELAKNEAAMAAARAALGEAAFASAWSRGAEMSLEDAVQDALELLP